LPFIYSSLQEQEMFLLQALAIVTIWSLPSSTHVKVAHHAFCGFKEGEHQTMRLGLKQTMMTLMTFVITWLQTGTIIYPSLG
jgi:heme/copper-type cytochrome/quinol oxidase subunit 3